jgi:hypothetical protein
MLEFLIDNICVLCGERVFVQTVCNSMDTNRTPIHDQLFLYSYEPDIMCVYRGEGWRVDSHQYEEQTIPNLKSLSHNNSKFGYCVNSNPPPIEHETEDYRRSRSAWFP